ncbi:ester cyclase [Actinacidiphila yeochonensis]|uniref:ester cyclase n=1 Tax=Actinacidiphila yeochonensis TaxID=89050 RepID=UPI00056C87A9|nr:ester cyclase [Actinacidiphila yeochonensis]
MSQQDNIAAQTAFGEAVNSGNLAAIADVVAPGAVDHDPAPGQGPGPEGYQAMFGDLRRAFPDLHVEVEHLLATEDELAFAYTITGTHRGELAGHAPTGRAVSFRGLQISRFENGRLVERWGSSDELGMMRQLGLV